MTEKILVLEDDPFIALDMESLLEEAGYDVLGPVASSRAALKLLDDEGAAPDCALLDFFVSGGTSEFVARELGRRDVPFMLVTGNKSAARDALDDKDLLIRSKPVRPARIVADVQDMLAAA